MAKKYLDPSQMTITCLGSEKDKIDAKKILTKWQGDYSKAWKKTTLDKKVKAVSKSKKINWNFGGKTKGMQESASSGA